MGGFFDCSHPVQEKVIEVGGMLNILGLSDVLVAPPSCRDFCCEIETSLSCHRLADVGVDQEFGRVHVFRLGFGGVVCHAIAGCRMAQGRGAKGGR